MNKVELVHHGKILPHNEVGTGIFHELCHDLLGLDMGETAIIGLSPNLFQAGCRALNQIYIPWKGVKGSRNPAR